MNNIDSPLSMPDLFSMFGSFVLVLLLLGVVLFILKKVQMTSSVSNGDRKIQIIEIMPTSNKQKIMLLKVENQQFLVGVSGQNLNQLGQWTTTESIPKKIKQNNSKLNDSNDKVLQDTPYKNSNAYERADQNSKKNNFLEQKKINSPEKSSLLDEKLNKFTELSSIKQTENLLSFAKQIRGTLNQSISKTHRTL